MANVKLTPAMLELLKAIQDGVTKVHWMGGYQAYAWRNDTSAGVTTTVLALERRGLVERDLQGNGNGVFILTEEGWKHGA